MFHVKHAYLSGLHYEIECSLKIQVSLAKSGAGFGSALADKIPNRIRGVSSWLRSVQSERSIFNTGFSWLQSWEECAKQTCLQHGFKACVEDWASAAQCSTGALLRMLRHGGSQSCAKEDAQSASRSSRAIRDRDLLGVLRPRTRRGKNAKTFLNSVGIVTRHWDEQDIDLSIVYRVGDLLLLR